MAASPFLRLPLLIRQKVYSYLLAPRPDEDVMTINYTLEWPFLENPRNSTFTAHQLDHCRCPQQPFRTGNTPTTDHIYTRYECHGPNVRFIPKSEELWLLTAPNGPFNILRPASRAERAARPSAGIVLVNKQTYQEALPFLYRDRNFLFLTGPCPRGRYQAYATQAWLSRLSPLAREHVTTLSLICQSWEEDCQDKAALRAYYTLTRYLLSSVPRCVNLCLNYWSSELPVYPFRALFQRKGMRIFVKKVVKGGTCEDYCDEFSFLKNHSEHADIHVENTEYPTSQQQQNVDEVGEEADGLWAKHPMLEGTSMEDVKNVNISDSNDAQRKFSLGDDWVVAGLSPSAPNLEMETDVWEMV